MFISIEDDVFDNIEQIEDVYDDKIVAIDVLFYAMYKGKHIVFAKPQNLDKIISNSIFTERTRQYVMWVKRKYSEIYSCREFVCKYISVSVQNVSVETSEKCYKVPLKYVLDIDKAKLLTENETDARFYLQLTDYIMKRKKVGSFYSVCFENDSCHGGNVKSKVEEVSNNQKIALCVVDSDKDYPEAGIGDTCKTARKAIIKEQNKSVIDLLELPVREKENLIPANVYCMFTDAGIVRVISEKFSNDETIANFFDIKDGVKYKRISNPDVKWMGYYGDLIKECEKNKVCNNSAQYADELYITGVGDSICGTIADVLFGEKKVKNVPKRQAEEIMEKRVQMLENIPEYLMFFWERIYENILTWGCCINSTIFPSQREW